LRGFERGKTIVVPSWRYKAIVSAGKLLTAGLRRRVLIALVPRRPRQKQQPAND